MSRTDHLVSKLKEIVGETNIVTDPDKRKAFGLDGKEAKAVVSPGTIDEVSKVVCLAHEKGLAIVPRGNGTKMGMGGVPKKMDIVLSTARLNRMTDKDCENLTLTAESGMTLAEVQENLAKEGKGYCLPLDPPFSEKATLGGIIATNSSGPKRLLYGSGRDLLIGLKAVFPNGDIVTSGGKTVKNVSGYDMCKLLIGSLGTLGILCEMTFKLLPLPEKEATLLIPFVNLGDVTGLIHEVVHSQLIPASIETLNTMAVERMKFLIPIPPGGNYLLAIGLEGVSESVERQISELSDRGKKYGALEAVELHSEKHLAFGNALRDLSQRVIEDYPNLLALKSTFLISKMGDMLKSYEEIVREQGIDFAFLCHSGNGILYSYILVEKDLRSKTGSFIELIEKLKSEAVKNEGNLVVEASPLSIKKRIDVWGQARSDVGIARRIKEEIDPKGILNPGRFVGGI